MEEETNCWDYEVENQEHYDDDFENGDACDEFAEQTLISYL